MLKQKQATLLEGLFCQVVKRKGIVVAEDLLQSLLDEGATTRPLINRYISSYLNSDAYVNKYLVRKDEQTWLSNIDEFLMDILITRYEEVLTWKAILRPPLKKVSVG